MSIADKITKLQTDITNAYNSIQTKGGTIPTSKNTENLTSAINSISTNKGVLMESEYVGFNTSYALGAERAHKLKYTRAVISTITFLFDGSIPEHIDSWDVSLENDGSVMAYVSANGSNYNLYIVGNGSIKLPKNCYCLLTNYSICTAINNINLLETNDVENVQRIFNGCKKIKSLDLSNWNIENITSMYNMFGNCMELESLNMGNWDTSKVLNMNGVFSECYYLTELNLKNWDTHNVLSMTSIFNLCQRVTDLDISNFDASKITSASSIMGAMNALTNITGSLKNLGASYTTAKANYGNYTLTLSGSPNLTKQSLLNIINGLYDLNLTYNVANGGTLYSQKLVLGSTNLAKLSSAEVAIATNKGWTVS